MKLIKHGETGCLKTELEGPEKFVRFLFDQFKSRGHNNYAELFDDAGKLVGVKSWGVTQTF